jgi:hypothetical protein
MGFPAGWTDSGRNQMGLFAGAPARQAPKRAPNWPRGRYPADWDRSQLWPGFEWEPSRTIPDGPPVAGRPARLRALGNAVCPQQGALALSSLVTP